jgi:hypothetical protein
MTDNPSSLPPPGRPYQPPQYPRPDFDTAGWEQAPDGSWHRVETKRSTGALVVGIVGVVMGIIPLLAIPAIICGLIALVLGISGWRGRRKLARAATVLGVVAIGLGIVGFVIVDDAIDDLDRELDCIGNENLEDCE